jgi:transcription initiation factor TFIIIB Brf1 subunit/transcription initiation factor TFIIB
MRCPFCNSKKVVPNGDREHFCKDCKKLFDDDPDEGGSYSDRSPSARMERQERLQKRQMGGGPLRRMNRGYANQ